MAGGGSSATDEPTSLFSPSKNLHRTSEARIVRREAFHEQLDTVHRDVCCQGVYWSQIKGYNTTSGEHFKVYVGLASAVKVSGPCVLGTAPYRDIYLGDAADSPEDITVGAGRRGGSGVFCDVTSFHFASGWFAGLPGMDSAAAVTHATESLHPYLTASLGRCEEVAVRRVEARVTNERQSHPE